MAKQFQIHAHDELESTQVLARQWVEEGRAKPGDVIVTKKQTAGYGRRGRAWQMPEGNLAVTWIEDFSEDKLSWMGFAVSLGLYDTFKQYLPASVAVTLKWPNDVLLDGAKACGILIEVADDKLLVGMGVNIAASPETDQKTAALADFVKRMPTANDFLNQFLTHYARWSEIGEVRGFPGLRRDWLLRAHDLNSTLTARFADGRILTGTFVDLDPSGALILNTESGLEKVTAADIFITGSHDKKANAG